MSRVLNRALGFIPAMRILATSSTESQDLDLCPARAGGGDGIQPQTNTQVRSYGLKDREVHPEGRCILAASLCSATLK